MTKKPGLQFTISREKLIEGLAAVVPSTPARSTLPVLANILIETTSRGVRLSGTDLDIGIRHEIAADVSGEGSITIPAKRLLSIAKELPPAPVKVRTISDGQVVIDCGRSSYKLRTLPVDDFPSFPKIDFGSSSAWIMNAGDVHRLAKLTGFATSDKDSRPILHGILVEVTGQRIRFVATDGHRLALVDRMTQSQNVETVQVIVPPKALDHVGRLFSSEDELDVAQSENHLGFRSPTTEIFTRLIEGPYPNYDQVIPKKHPRLSKVDRLSLISSIKRLVPIASDAVHRLRLVFIGGVLQLSAMTPDIGEGHDELPAQLVEGDDVTISANAAFLLEVLSRVEGDDVMIRTGAPSRAMLFTPFTKEKGGSSLFLLMPMRSLED